MSTDSAQSGERPLANAGPILFVAGLGLIAVIALVLSLFRDPGLPAYVEDSYMRVAGGLVTPDFPVRSALGLAATLSQAPPGPVRVPAIDDEGYTLDGGTHVTLGGTPAAMAIYHNALRDMVTWHGVQGYVRGSSTGAGPASRGWAALLRALQGHHHHRVLAGGPDPDGHHVCAAG